MIYTNRTITIIKGGTCSIDEGIVLYRGDREVEVSFTLIQSRFKFSSGENLIITSNAAYGQLLIDKPDEYFIFSEITPCKDGKVIFTITEAMIDELEEVGFYDIQIRLFDEDMTSRITIPPVSKVLEVREPMVAEDTMSLVDSGMVDVSKVMEAEEGEDLLVFDEFGNYIETEWETRDIISKGRLNKIEDAISGVTYRIGDTTERVQAIENVNNQQAERMQAIENVNDQQTNKIQAIEERNTIQDANLQILYNSNQEYTADIVEGQLPQSANDVGYINTMTGDTRVNVIDQKDPIPLTKSYTVETGNKVVFQGDYDGKAKPHVYGNTLVNLNNTDEIWDCACSGAEDTDYTYIEKDKYSIKVNKITGTASYFYLYKPINHSLFKSDTDYTLIFTSENVFEIGVMTGNAKEKIINQSSCSNGFNCIKVTSNDLSTLNFNNNIFYIYARVRNWFMGEISISDVIVLEGDYTNKPIPNYFEGLQSSFEEQVVPSNLLNLDSSLPFEVKSTGIEEGRTILRDTTFTFKPNTEYTMVLDLDNVNVSGDETSLAIDYSSGKGIGHWATYGNGMNIVKFTTGNEVGNLWIYYAQVATASCTVKKCYLFEGDYSNYDFSDYDPSQSGKYKVDYVSVGKNKSDNGVGFSNWYASNTDGKEFTFEIVDNGFIIDNSIARMASTRNIISKLKHGTTYTLSFDVELLTTLDRNVQAYLFNDDWTEGIYGMGLYQNGKYTFTFTYDKKYIGMGIYLQSEESKTTKVKITNIQLEEGDTATAYEPYKQSIKTLYLNSPLLKGDSIEVSGNNIVHVHRYKQFVLNGTDYKGEKIYWNKGSTSTDDFTLFYKRFEQIGQLPSPSSYTPCFADTFPSYGEWFATDTEGVMTDADLNIRISNSKLNGVNSSGFNDYLAENPITVVYELATPTYEVISSNDDLYIDSYVGGHLDFNTAVPIEKVEFDVHYIHLKYLRPNVLYDVQFEADGVGIINILLGNWHGHRDVVKGVNKFTLTALSENTIFGVEGIGCNISNIVVTEATDLDFGYFKGLQSTFESEKVPTSLIYRETFDINKSDGNELDTYNNIDLVTEANKTYTIVFDTDVNGMYGGFIESNWTGLFSNSQTHIGTNKMLVTTSANGSRFRLRCNGLGAVAVRNLIVFEGDYSNWDFSDYDLSKVGKYRVDYVSRGKNLFNINKVQEGKYQYSDIAIGRFDIVANKEYKITEFIELKPNTTYTKNFHASGAFYNKNKEPIKTTRITSNIMTFTTPSDCAYVVFSTEINRDVNQGQLEEGNATTSYEPFKQERKTVYLNSPLLEGDTLEVRNGEVYHIHNYKQVVVDGRYEWVGNIPVGDSGIEQRYANTTDFYDMKRRGDYSEAIMCDKLKTLWNYMNVEEGITGYPQTTGYIGENWLYINTTKTGEELRQWLSENPITVVYQLAEPYEEKVSSQSLDIHTYANGELSVKSAVPINSMSSVPFVEELKYLYTNTSYSVQFLAYAEGKVNIYLGGTELASQNVVKGYNKYTLTTPSTLVDNLLKLDGMGIDVSQVVVTEATDKEFRYFEGLSSVGEDGLELMARNNNLLDYKQTPIAIEFDKQVPIESEMPLPTINTDNGLEIIVSDTSAKFLGFVAEVTVGKKYAIVGECSSDVNYTFYLGYKDGENHKIIAESVGSKGICVFTANNDEVLIIVGTQNNVKFDKINLLEVADSTLDGTETTLSNAVVNGDSLLSNSGDGIAYVNEIQGNTMTNLNKDSDKELVLMSEINEQGQDVDLTNGVDGGLVDVYLEGNTMVNVCSQQDSVPLTMSYTAETGNHVVLQGDYDGKAKPYVFGNTLVNLWEKSQRNAGGSIILEGCTIHYNSTGAQYNNFFMRDKSLFKGATTYSIIITISNVNNLDDEVLYITSKSNAGDIDVFGEFNNIQLNSEGTFIKVLTTMEDISTATIGLRSYIDNPNQRTVGSCDITMLVLEGDYTNKPIPSYFEGLQSSFEDNLVTEGENAGKYKVEYKVTGKNLVDNENNLKLFNNNKYISTIQPIPIKESTTYCISYAHKNGLKSYDGSIYLLDENQNRISTAPYHLPFNTGNAKFISFNLGQFSEDRISFVELSLGDVSIQTEEGSTATAYEPYKEYTKTLYLNSPLLEGDSIEVQGNNIVHVHRYGQKTFDGSDDENWRLYTTNPLNYQYVIPREDMPTSTNLICDKFKPSTNSINEPNNVYVGVNNFNILAPLELSTLELFKAWLQENPITVVYELATPIYEVISSNDNLYIDSYAGGHLDFDSAVPVERVMFEPYYLSLSYLKPSTSYVVQFEADNVGKANVMLGNWISEKNIAKGINRFELTSANNNPFFRLNGIGCNISNIVVTEAVNEDFGYFQGMKSVGELEELEVVSHNTRIDNSQNKIADLYESNGQEVFANRKAIISGYNYIPKDPNIAVRAYNKTTGEEMSNSSDFYGMTRRYYDKNKNYLGISYVPSAYYVRYRILCRATEGVTDEQFENLFFAYDKQTEYVPHQSQTQQLTHEPLRAAGDVKDRYVLIDGEWYIERNCKEIVLDGSQSFVMDTASSTEQLSRFSCNIVDLKNNRSTLVSDKMPLKTDYRLDINPTEGIFTSQNGNSLFVDLLVSKMSQNTVTGLVTYLKSNPITIVYQLTSPTYEPIEYNPLEVYTDLAHISNNSTIPCVMDVKNHGFNAMLKPNTTYTISSNQGVQTFQTGATLDDCLRLYGTGTMKDVTILEGAITDTDLIPSHFSGIESAFEQEYDEEVGKYKVEIKTTGKNLFDGKLEIGTIYSNNGQNVDNSSEVRSINYTRVLSGRILIIRSNATGDLGVRCYDEYKNYIGVAYNGVVIGKKVEIIELLPGTKYIRFKVMNTDLACNYMITTDLSATAYEPYKSSTISFYLDEPLRGIGDVRDRVFIENGELKVERKVGSMILDGSEPNWSCAGIENSVRMSCTSLSKAKKGQCILDNFATAISYLTPNSSSFLASMDVYSNYLYVSMPKELINRPVATDNSQEVTDAFLEWLSKNPTTLIYELATPTIETVEVNQPLVLKSYKNMNIQTSSNINPSIDLSYSPIETSRTNVASVDSKLDKVVLSHEPLRSVGDVKDRYVLIDGEWYIERNCGEIVLDGSISYWDVPHTVQDSRAFGINYNEIPNVYNQECGYGCVICDILPTQSDFRYTVYEQGISLWVDPSACFVGAYKSSLSPSEYFQQNPAKVIYQLATPTYEKIDYSPLGVFNGTTNILVKSCVPTNMTVKNHGFNTIIKPSTQYTIKVNANSTSAITYNLGGKSVSSTNGTATITTSNTIDDNTLRISGKGIEVENVRIIETSQSTTMPNTLKGIESAFEQSYDEEVDKYKVEIKTTGKNLISERVYNRCVMGTQENQYFGKYDGVYTYIAKVIPNKTYTLSRTGGDRTRIGLSKGFPKLDDKLKMIFHSNVFHAQRTFTVDGDYDYCLLYLSSDETAEPIENLQLEEGTTATAYEPYKSSTISFYLDEPLRGIGDVRDRVFIENGEVKVERKCGKVVLDGSETWKRYEEQDTNDLLCLNVTIANGNMSNVNRRANISDTFVCGAYWNNKSEVLDRDINDRFFLKVAKAKLSTQDADGFKQWLSKNPTTVVYQLAEPTVETICDLSDVLTIYNNGHIFLNTNVPVSKLEFIPFVEELKYLYPNKKYLVQFNTNVSSAYADITLGGTKLSNVNLGLSNKITITTPSTLVDNKLAISGNGFEISNVVVTEYTDKNVKYFKGIQSVGDGGIEIVNHNMRIDNSQNKIADINSITGKESISTNCIVSGYNYVSIERASMSAVRLFNLNGEIISNSDTLHGISKRYYDKDKNYLGTEYTPNTYYVRYRVLSKVSAVATEEIFNNSYFGLNPHITFISHQSNKQTLSHEPLRSAGDVKDRYVLVDGQWYIERNCGEILLNGSEELTYTVHNIHGIRIEGVEPIVKHYNNYNGDNPNLNFKVDNLEPLNFDAYFKDTEDEVTPIGLTTHNHADGMLYTNIKGTNVAETKQWFQQNPTTVIYQLATPQYEKINYNPLRVYDGTNYISTNSIIPLDIKVQNHGFNAIIKPNTDYTVISNKGIQHIHTANEIDSLRFFGNGKVNNVIVLEEEDNNVFPSALNGLDSAFEQELVTDGLHRDKYRVNIKVTGDEGQSNELTFYINEPLRGVGTVRDKIIINNNEIVVQRRCGEVIIDKDSDIIHNASADNVERFAFRLSNVMGGKYLKFKSNNFAYNTDGFIDGIGFIHNANMIMAVSKAKAINVEEFKQWLADNPTTVIYPLGTMSYELATLDEFTENVLRSYNGTSVIEYNTYIPVLTDVTYKSSLPNAREIQDNVETLNAINDEQDINALESQYKLCILELLMEDYEDLGL